MAETKSSQKKGTGNIIEGKLNRDYSNAPFFKKKKKDAIVFLKRHNLFETLKKKK